MKSVFSLNSPVVQRIAVTVGAMLLAACGGGGGGSSAAPAATAPATASVKYPLAGAIATAVPEGVVLQDGLGNTVELAAGGTEFKFKEGQPYLSAGTVYDVSVKAQPKGYTCTMTGGKDTVNVSALNGNTYTVAVRCSGPLTNQTYVAYTGTRDPSFGFYSFALGTNGEYFVTVASELQRVDAAGKMHRMTLLDKSTGQPLPEMSVQNAVVGPTGNIYLAVYRNAEASVIMRVTQTATEGVYLAETLADSFVDFADQRRSLGFAIGMSVDSADNVYVADRTYHLIRKISSTGVVSTFAGMGTPAVGDGTGTAAGFYFQRYSVSMSHDANDNLYVESGSDKYAIRKITPAGVVTTLAVPDGGKAVSDEAGNLYFVTPTRTGAPNILRVAATGGTDVLVSNGTVTFDHAPKGIQANAIGYVQAMRVARGVLYFASSNPMAIYKIVL